MEMLQLRYFYETAKLGSFAKTAEKYMVPPTSVSASVKRLEKELGCALFHRAHNRITLNEQGVRLQNSLRVVFRELDGAVTELSASAADDREIRILVRAMRMTIADRIIAYQKAYPQVRFKTVFDLEDTAIEDYDIIIDEQSDRYRDYESFALYHTRIRLCVCVGHPLVGQRLTLRQLKAQPFISIGKQNSMFRILTRACERAGFTPRVAVQSNDLLCEQRFFAAGLGVGLFREYDGANASSERKVLNVTDFNETQTICGYYKSSGDYGNVRHFLRFLQNAQVD
jgi:DNA-binding transcriptional LysR family regulator